MANFTKMEQAERMIEKYRFYALEAQEANNFNKMEKYENLADRLEEAISKIIHKQATKRDWEVFNNAIGERTRLDVERELIKELNN
jgi:hypothetical protein